MRSNQRIKLGLDVNTNVKAVNAIKVNTVTVNTNVIAVIVNIINANTSVTTNIVNIINSIISNINS